MFNFLKNIKEKDPAAQNYLEIILCYPGVHAMMFYKVSHLLYKLHIPVIPRFISYLASIITNIEIHPAAKIGRNLFIDHGHAVIIGSDVTICDNVTIYQGVTIGGRRIKNAPNAKRHPIIKNNVIIAAGTKILGDIIIGENAKIGANSLVIEDVAANSLIISNKAITKTSADIIEYYI
jgi:serine O-acetyltransferase